MSNNLMIDSINGRVSRDKEEGDIAYFHALTLKLEYITKIVTAGVVACIGDDSERHRYGLEYELVRANAIGDWVATLVNALTGPPAQFLATEARSVTRDLTERVGAADWRHVVVSRMDAAAEEVGIKTTTGRKVALRQFFEIGATFRNRTRGHGATTADQCSRCCHHLSHALDLLVANIEILQIPWVHLHRNFSGKYRVAPLVGDMTPFAYLGRVKGEHYENGVFLHLNRHIRVPFVVTNSSVQDVFLPNGNHNDSTYEMLSYITNETNRGDASAWSDPPSRVQPSETQGLEALGELGNTLANLPPVPRGHVPRRDLESRVAEELLITDRHPIVSLTGPGGIGKTTTAIAAISDIAHRESPPYGLIVWISARDIDLLESGPKPVAPKAVTLREIAKATVGLLEAHSEKSDPESFLRSCLAKETFGPTLFVLDNFETVQSPSDVFRWLDASVRPPNKILITTRFRNFVGDYALEVGGMTDEEATSLIERHARRLGITELIDGVYRRTLISESGGHPYVIKILLGGVAKEQRAVKPKRIAASDDALLRALFERTYANLSPAGQRIFLLLCSWRVFVPEVAVEAVVLRPGVERFDVRAALDELQRYSLVDQVGSDAEDETFVCAPLAAAMYGLRKLEVSPFKGDVLEDRKLLLDFGAGRREDAHRGVMPRVERLIETVADRASTNPRALEESMPVLEFLAERVPHTYRRLADLVLELEISDAAKRAKEYLRRFLESVTPDARREAWERLVSLCYQDGDVMGEAHALSEIALLPDSGPESVGSVANRLNNLVHRIREKRNPDIRAESVRIYLDRVIVTVENHKPNLSATNCSRLAWLYINVGKVDRARDVARAGCDRDPLDEHCRRLVERLDS